MNSTPKLNKEQEHESLFKKKLLKKYIISQPEDLDLVRPYIDLKKHPLSWVIISKETLGKKWEKNLERVWDWVFKLMSTYDYYAIDSNRFQERFQE